GSDRPCGARPVLPPPAPRPESGVWLESRRAPDLLGRRLRGNHRVRLPHGGGLRESAVPAERARLLDPRGGRGLPPRDHLHGARFAPFGPAPPVTRPAPHTALPPRLPPPRLPHPPR